MNKLPDKALLRIDEVAEYFRVTTRAVRYWITAGDLPVYKVRSVTRIKREDVVGMLKKT